MFQETKNNCCRRVFNGNQDIVFEITFYILLKLPHHHLLIILLTFLRFGFFRASPSLIPFEVFMLSHFNYNTWGDDNNEEPRQTTAHLYMLTAPTGLAFRPYILSSASVVAAGRQFMRHSHKKKKRKKKDVGREHYCVPRQE